MYCAYRFYSAKEEYSELACHCEEGEARRGNPFPLLTFRIHTCYEKKYGLPRQRAHWLAMTFILIPLKYNLAE